MFLTSFTRASTTGARFRHVSGRAIRCLLLSQIRPCAKARRSSQANIVDDQITQFLATGQFPTPTRAVRNVPKLMILLKLPGYESTKSCLQFCHHYVGKRRGKHKARLSMRPAPLRISSFDFALSRITPASPLATQGPRRHRLRAKDSADTAVQKPRPNAGAQWPTVFTHDPIVSVNA